MTDLFFPLGSTAQGTIQAREDQQERLEEFTKRVASGEFHKSISTLVTIPARCVDGRSVSTVKPPLAPNAAGGTESLFVADDLTTKRFDGSGGSTLAGYIRILDFLKAARYEIGGHTDSRAIGATSGCGANDRLADIYDFIASNADILRDVAGRLGVDVADETHETIQRNAAARTLFSEGAVLLEALQKRAKNEFLDQLDGDHNEVVAVINTKPGTTLDRDALAKEFGNNYQAFNVDVWSFEGAAKAISKSDNETQQKIVAMVYYNLATTMVLAGPQMRVVVVS